MKRRLLVSTLLCGLAISNAAWAGETPLYQPSPEWVIPAQLPAANAQGGPAILIFDRQQRISGGQLWAYADSAQRITSAEQLNQMANLILPWLPDKGDLIIHELAIVRGGESIDLLAGGKTFTVIRREQALERRELTGVLTATMAVEGLRVGDILRLRASTTGKDDALAGHVQALAPIITAPATIAQGRLRTIWDNDSKVQWKLGVSGIKAEPVRGNRYTELNLALPGPKPSDVPPDAPGRFHPLPLLEVSTFSSWSDVSRTMAPLFATEGLIKPASPLIAEINAIKGREQSALGRTQMALQLVQDQIRYLAVSMDGGNYVPQTPDQTWSLRYGDCKAKTLLLLAMLREMGIKAEAVLAHVQLGGMVVNRLPSAAAFNHIIVRAEVDGESLWLDGTGLGSRIEDIRDTPPFFHVLPLRPEGAELMVVEPRKSGRPTFDLTMNVDESSSVDLPSVFDLSLILRGATAMQINMVRSQMDETRQREVLAKFLSELVGESQFSTITLVPNEQAGQMMIKARGVSGSSWRWDDKMMRRAIDRALAAITFEPDRARATWSAIPVATPAPDSRRMRMEIRLPEGGRGFRIDGETALSGRIAGREISRSVSLDKNVLTIEARIDATGAEIAASDIAAEKDKLMAARTRAPQLVAPADTMRSWDVAARDPKGATQIAAAEQVLSAAIAHAPEQAAGYRDRAYFRRMINDSKGAMSDLDKAIELDPDVERYLMRAQLREERGELEGALADADAARLLDPSSAQATLKAANLRAERGDMTAAIDLLDQRISLGGETRQTYQQGKAALLGQYGDPAEALKLLGKLMEDRPGMPGLLNLSCWIKGTREVALESATKDCTSALELSSNPYGILDSRALVSYRLGHYDDAMRDLNAVLSSVPGLAESRFMRAVVLARMDRAAESGVDLAIARRIKPRIDEDYARYGIKP